MGLFLSLVTWICLPSTIQRPVANMQVVNGSCYSWWKTLALLTWEGELQARKRTTREKTKYGGSGILVSYLVYYCE